MKTKILILSAMLVLPVAYSASAAPAKGPTLQNAYDFFHFRQYTYFADAPYLAFDKDQIDLEVFGKAGRAADAKLDLAADGDETVSEASFTTEVCNQNPQPGGFSEELQPVFDDMKERLAKEVAVTSEKLFRKKIPASFIKSAKNGDKYKAPTFTLTYEESGAYCDSFGGKSASYKIYVKN